MSLANRFPIALFYRSFSCSVQLKCGMYMYFSLTIIVDDSKKNTKEANHRGKKTRTEPSFGYFLGGLRPATLQSITDKNNAATWERFIGCMSDISIENVKVDFAMSKPSGPNADYSSCPIPDPVDPESTTLTMGELGKYAYPATYPHATRCFTFNSIFHIALS